MLRTLASLATQLASWIAYPEHTRRRQVIRGSARGRSSCGLCPGCRTFVRIDVPDPEEQVSCPECGKIIHELDPLGSDQ